jgi:hypothetical protein
MNATLLATRPDITAPLVQLIDISRFGLDSLCRDVDVGGERRTSVEPNCPRAEVLLLTSIPM